VIVPGLDFGPATAGTYVGFRMRIHLRICKKPWRGSASFAIKTSIQIKKQPDVTSGCFFSGTAYSAATCSVCVVFAFASVGSVFIAGAASSGRGNGAAAGAANVVGTFLPAETSFRRLYSVRTLEP
jgi:hypothetical protein